METRKIIILGVMAVLGGGVFYAVNSLGTPTVAPVQTAAPEIKIQEVEYASVLAIDVNVSTGQRITEDMMTRTKWPVEALRDDLINLDDQPNAKELFINALARQALVQGEPLTHAKVIKAGDSGILAATLKPGMRAVTTRISVDTAAGGFIHPGDKVDIIMRENFTLRRDESLTGSGGGGGAERNNLYIAQTLFENVKVLAIDQTFATNPDTGAAIPGSTATFELSQSDAELLQEAEGYGDIFLTLRGVNGSGYKGRSAAAVAREEAAPAPSSLTIYRNGEPTAVALQQRN